MQEAADRREAKAEAARIKQKEIARIERIKKIKAQEEARLRSIESAKKQNLWHSYYIEPEGCDVFQSDKHMVECVNHKKRAKEEFNKKYQQGLLKNT